MRLSVIPAALLLWYGTAAAQDLRNPGPGLACVACSSGSVILWNGAGFGPSGFTDNGSTISTTEALSVGSQAAGTLNLFNGGSVGLTAGYVAQMHAVANTNLLFGPGSAVGLSGFLLLGENDINSAVQPLVIYGNPVFLPLSVLIGGLATFGSTVAATGSAGEIASTKIAATGTAPGAGYAKIEWVAGTTGGTCKLIGYAGTSTTAVTIVDNVGAGC